VILDSTPFYAESGGQIGDAGEIALKSSLFEVVDTRKRGGLFLHHGIMRKGSLTVGDMVDASIDIERRQAIRLNHSATHLLHAALRELLGKHVEQKGSLVDENKLRFDFSHGQGLDSANVHDVEVSVNEKIRGNFEISSNLMTYDAAIESGAVALFGEKYGDEVRVLSMSEFSTELCGGTHASRTGDIGIFKIVSESGVASGVRRIEAVTGDIAIEHLAQIDRKISQLSVLLKSNESDLEKKVEQIISRNRSLEKETQELKHKLSGKSGHDLKKNAVTVNGVTVVSEILEDADIDALRVACDDLKSRFTDAVIVLGSVGGDNIKLIAGVSKSLTKVMKAGELVNFVARQVGGKGGGRPDMAQAGGTNIEKLPEALSSVLAWVENKTT
jgi:alanyl-tRNA synthetase